MHIGPLSLSTDFRFFCSLIFECNIYRVAIFRAPCPFRGHELAGPCSIEHPGLETRPRPQPGSACSSGQRKPRSHGQARELEVRSLPRSSRTHRPGDAFEKIEGGCELRVLEPAHVTAAYVGLMSKRFLAEAAGASQVLDVQCYTVPQVHARGTDTVHEISPRDICYIRR